MSVPIIFDKIRIIFRTVVIIISIRVIFFRTSYITRDKDLNYFIIIVILFVTSMNILIFFPNTITLLLGWDGLGLTSYLLVIYYKNDKSLAAGILTALTNRIGDALLILAISWILMSGNWISFSLYNIIYLTPLIIILAATTKRAQIPFRAWLPAAIAAPTPVSALVHSSTLVTAGIYLIIRFFSTLNSFEIIKFLCFYLGTITCFIARSAAIFENDLKKIIALSTLRQLGIIIVALGLEQPTIRFFHLITHALFKALLFICAGTIIHIENNNQDIRIIGRLANFSIINIVFFNVANLSLCGIPFLAGFYSKDTILETFFITQLPISTRFLLISCICLTAAYSIRLRILTLWSTPKRVNFQPFCRKFTYISYIILIFGAICGGAYINWIIHPLITTPNIPIILKIIAITLITILSLTIYITINLRFKIRHFTASMWFLTYISSNPINYNTINLSKIIIYNETTWIEKLSGKGVKTSITQITVKANTVRDISLSELISFFFFALFIIIILHCHYSVNNTLTFQVRNP